MNRKEYMDRLEQLLLILPEEEREEALQYYTDYFDDAGIENEDRVIQELGSPEEVSAKIRAGFSEEYAEYSEQGFEDSRFQLKNKIILDPNSAEGEWEEIPKEEDRQQKRARKPDTNMGKMILLILILLAFSPLIMSGGITILAILFGLAVAVLAILFAVGVSGFAVIFAGGAIIVAGIAKMFVTPAVGILAVGIGCILFAIGILLSWVMISLVIKVIPGFIRGLVNLLGKPFRKAGVR